jgi:Cu+-exporting ATPase
MQDLVMNERKTNDRHTASGAPGVQALDPVCGMEVDPATSKHRFDHGGRIFHFCSAGCQGDFAAASDDSYLKPAGAAPGPAEAGVIYTCPTARPLRILGTTARRSQ